MAGSETNTPKCRICDVTYPEIGIPRHGLWRRAASRIGRGIKKRINSRRSSSSGNRNSSISCSIKVGRYQPVLIVVLVIVVSVFCTVNSVFSVFLYPPPYPGGRPPPEAVVGDVEFQWGNVRYTTLECLVGWSRDIWTAPKTQFKCISVKFRNYAFTKITHAKNLNIIK